MTPDELRALAEALAEYAESPDRVSYQAEPILQAAGYLRACADEKPAVWVDSIARPQPHAVTKLTYRSAHDARDGVEYVPLYTHPAPAAPQAEPKRPIIEVITEFDDIANWYCVILIVGETRHRFFIDYYTMQLAEAEDFAKVLRTALGIGDKT